MSNWQLGLQAFREGRMREAADRLQAALGENELAISLLTRYETCAYLGAALYSLGLPAEALTAFEMAYKFSPTETPSDDLMMNLAHAYLAAGRRRAAREALRLLLLQSPGHVAAKMLAARLDSTPLDEDVTGAVLGASPRSAEIYIRTLTFTQTSSGGYAPAEVQEVLSQLQRFIDGISEELEQAQSTVAQYELEILRYRQMEDAVVENMIQSQQSSMVNQESQTDGANRQLSPIEILFQQKS